MKTTRYRMALVVALTCSLPAQEIVRPVVEAFGFGCERATNQGYELFAPGAFDLDVATAGGAITWRPGASGGYVVTDEGGTLPYASDPALTLSEMSAAQDLGFSFAYAEGRFGVPATTDAILIDRAGYIEMDPATAAGSLCCSAEGALSRFLDDPSRFAVFGQGLNPLAAGGGAIRSGARVVSGQSVFVVTWDDVMQGQDPAARVTCQIQFWDDDRCVMSWDAVSATSESVLVGWSGGLGVRNYGDRDLSELPLDLGSPVELEPRNLVFDGFGPAAPFTSFVIRMDREGLTAPVLLMGLAPVAVPLDVLGLPNCELYTLGELGAVPGFSSTIGAWPITSLGLLSPAAIGVPVQVQGVGLQPGANALGLEMTNGASISAGRLVTGSNLPLITVRYGGGGGPPLPIWGISFNLTADFPTIVSLELDLALSTRPPAIFQRFVVDPGLFSGIEHGGESQFGCPNSYQGTDVATGLVYRGTDVSPCDPSATTGFILDKEYLPSFLAGQYQRIRFEFDDFGPGEEFLFRIGTLGGVLNGLDMDGCLVKIGFADGSSVSGELIGFGTPDGIAAQAFR